MVFGKEELPPDEDDPWLATELFDVLDPSLPEEEASDVEELLPSEPADELDER